MLMVPSPTVGPEMVGAPGTVAGFPVTGSLEAPWPWLLTAATTIDASVPFVSPVMTSGESTLAGERSTKPPPSTEYA